MFLEAWPAAFLRARADELADEEAAAARARSRGLADDLLEVATRLGAHALVAQAVMLRTTLASGEAGAVLAAQQRVQAALAPVLVALLRAP